MATRSLKRIYIEPIRAQLLLNHRKSNLDLWLMQENEADMANFPTVSNTLDDQCVNLHLMRWASKQDTSQSDIELG